MKKVNFIIVGEEIEEVINNSDMSVEFVNRLIRTFMDLGWIMTGIKTEGWFDMVTDNSVKFSYVLNDHDGECPYDLEESDFVHLLVDDEPVVAKKIGYQFMSNLG